MNETQEVLTHQRWRSRLESQNRELDQCRQALLIAVVTERQRLVEPVAQALHELCRMRTTQHGVDAHYAHVRRLFGLPEHEWGDGCTYE